MKKKSKTKKKSGEESILKWGRFSKEATEEKKKEQEEKA